MIYANTLPSLFGKQFEHAFDTKVGSCWRLNDVTIWINKDKEVYRCQINWKNRNEILEWEAEKSAYCNHRLRLHADSIFEHIKNLK